MRPILPNTLSNTGTFKWKPDRGYAWAGAGRVPLGFLGFIPHECWTKELAGATSETLGLISGDTRGDDRVVTDCTILPHSITSMTSIK